MSTKRNVQKRIISVVLFLFMSAIPILLCMYFEKPSLNVSELIEKENIKDMSLTIYYQHPYALMFYPISSVRDLMRRCDKKIVIHGSDLEEHIDLLKQISNDDLKPVMMKSSDLDLRVYYVLESKKNGKLFDVAMWGDDDDSIFVNGVEVKVNHIFYDVILPFIPKNEVEELENFIIHGRNLPDNS